MKAQLEATVDTKGLLGKVSQLLTRKELILAAGKGAEIIRDEAKKQAPEDPTGDLQRAIISGTNDQGAYVMVDEDIFPDAYLVEYGGIGGDVPARPFLRPAAHNKLKKVLQVIDRDLQRRVNKKVGR